MLKIEIKHNLKEKWEGNLFTKLYAKINQLILETSGLKIKNTKDVKINVSENKRASILGECVSIELYGLNCEETIQANFILELQSLFENIFPSEVRIDIVMVSPKLTLEKKISTEDLDPSLSFVREDLGPHDKFGF